MFTPLCRRIVKALQARGHTCWFDESALEAGAAWADRMAEGIHDVARAGSRGRLLYMMAPWGIRRPAMGNGEGFCLNEVAEALKLHLGDRLLILCLADCTPPPPLLGSNFALDLRGIVDRERGLPGAPDTRLDLWRTNWDLQPRLQYPKGAEGNRALQARVERLHDRNGSDGVVSEVVRLLEVGDLSRAAVAASAAALGARLVDVKDVVSTHPDDYSLRSEDLQRLRAEAAKRAGGDEAAAAAAASASVEEQAAAAGAGEEAPAEAEPEGSKKLPRVFLACSHWARPLAEGLRDILLGAGIEAEFDGDQYFLPKHDARRSNYVENALQWAAGKRATVEDTPGAATTVEQGSAPPPGKVIVLLTPNAVRRPTGFILDDTTRALYLGLDFIPIMLRWCDVPLFMCRIQYIPMDRALTGKEEPAGGSPGTAASGEALASMCKPLLRALQHGLDHEGEATTRQATLQRLLQPLELSSGGGGSAAAFWGREWLTREVQAWLHSDSHEQVRWYTGKLGLGKSAFASHLLMQLPEFRAVCLASRSSDDRQDARRAVMTMIHQATKQLPGFGERLLGKDSSLETAVATMTAAELFQTHFLEQLQAYSEERRLDFEDALRVTTPAPAPATPSLPSPGGAAEEEPDTPTVGIARHLRRGDATPNAKAAAAAGGSMLTAEDAAGVVHRSRFAILVDGLDAMTDDQGRNEMASLLASAKLPPWMRVLVLSREDSVLATNLGVTATHHRLEDRSAELQADMRAFLTDTLPGVGTAGAADPDVVLAASSQIVENAELVWTYADQVVDSLRRGRLALGSPASFPRGMVAMFHDLLSQQFPAEPDGSTSRLYTEQARPLLEVLAAAREPLDADLVMHIAGVEKARRHQLLGAFGPLLRAHKQQLWPFHSELLRWLDSENAREFRVEVGLGHEHLGLWAFRVWQAHGAEEFMRAADRAGSQHPGGVVSQYAVRHLLTHLQAARTMLRRNQGTELGQAWLVVEGEKEALSRAQRVQLLRTAGVSAFYHGPIERPVSEARLRAADGGRRRFLVRWSAKMSTFTVSIYLGGPKGKDCRHNLLHKIPVRLWPAHLQRVAAESREAGSGDPTGVSIYKPAQVAADAVKQERVFSSLEDCLVDLLKHGDIGDVVLAPSRSP